MSEEQKNDAPVTAIESKEETAPEKPKKIKFMNLKELETAIEKTKKNQGGLKSRYAHELVKKRDYLKSLQK